MEHELRLNFVHTCRTPMTYSLSLDKLSEFPIKSKIQCVKAINYFWLSLSCFFLSLNVKKPLFCCCLLLPQLHFLFFESSPGPTMLCKHSTTECTEDVFIILDNFSMLASDLGSSCLRFPGSWYDRHETQCWTHIVLLNVFAEVEFVYFGSLVYN